MPYKSESLKLGVYDRRVKLSAEDKALIKKDYESGMFSQRQLAYKWGVSRSLIQIITNKERARKVKERTKEHWKEYKQTKEEHAKSMQKLRKYKQELYKQGKLEV